MKYRVFKERRLFKPYKIQILDSTGWVDCVFVTETGREPIIETRYFWTAAAALREIDRSNDNEWWYE